MRAFFGVERNFYENYLQVDALESFYDHPNPSFRLKSISYNELPEQKNIPHKRMKRLNIFKCSQLHKIALELQEEAKNVFLGEKSFFFGKRTMAKKAARAINCANTEEREKKASLKGLS